MEVDDFSANNSGIKENFAVYVTGQSEDVFLTVQPYISNFKKNQVTANFPTSSSTFIFDFEKEIVHLDTEYTEEMKTIVTNTFLDSSSDGRYEIWQTNERHVHEASYYKFTLFDNQEGKGYDFYDESTYSDSRFYRLNLLNDKTLAIIYYFPWAERKDFYDQQIAIYDLEKKEVTERVFLSVPKEMGYVMSYLWDEENQQHVLLVNDDNTGKSRLMAFEPDGTLKQNCLSKHGIFGAKFTTYPVNFKQIIKTIYAFENAYSHGMYCFIDTEIDNEVTEVSFDDPFQIIDQVWEEYQKQKNVYPEYQYYGRDWSSDIDKLMDSFLCQDSSSRKTSLTRKEKMIFDYIKNLEKNYHK